MVICKKNKFAVKKIMRLRVYTVITIYCEITRKYRTMMRKSRNISESARNFRPSASDYIVAPM